MAIFKGPTEPPRQWDFYAMPRLFVRIDGAGGDGIDEYDAATTYDQGDVVVDASGFFYRSLQDANTGNTPSTSATFWLTIGTPYAWVQLYQDADGIFSDDPNGQQGTTTDNPLYPADGTAATFQIDTICEAVQHYGGWLIGWKLQSDNDTYFALSKTIITARDGPKVGKGTARILRLVPDGGDQDWTPTTQTVTVYNACEEIAVNTFLQLFREPISGKLMAVPLCVEAASCPCLGTCYSTSFPGLTSVFPCFNCEAFAAHTFVMTGVSGTCAWQADPYHLCANAGSGSDEDRLFTYATVTFSAFGANKWRVTISFNTSLDFVVYEVTAPTWNCTDPLVLDLLAVSADLVGCDDWPATITVTPCDSSGSGDVGADCCTGSCADGNVSSTLTATVTDKVGCFTSLPSTLDFSCQDSSPGFHFWELTTTISACGHTGGEIGCTSGVPTLSLTGGVLLSTLAEAGYVCYPFSAVFLLDDGGGNTATITVVG